MGVGISVGVMGARILDVRLDIKESTSHETYVTGIQICAQSNVKNRRGKCLLIAVDSGGHDAISPLDDQAHFSFEKVSSIAPDGIQYWADLYRQQGSAAIVVGTSDSALGRNVESAARTAAVRMNLTVVAIEDYAGNYFEVMDAPTNLLVVESEPAAQLIRDRLGATCPPIAIFSSCRYDRYRSKLDSLRAAVLSSWSQRGEPLEILWAGQPESQDGLATLARVAPAIRDLNARLLFKAHPRDLLYQEGRYPELLDALGIGYSDVSGLSIAECLGRAPRLVITQFSSVAIEAGFYGIPALHLLYRDIGGARLQQKKGYELPPHCQWGAGLVLQVPGTEHDMLYQALHSLVLREATICQFDDYFAAHTEMTPLLANHLIAFMGLT